MGIYDRPYYREERSSWLSGRSLVINLILLNVAVYVAEWLLGDRFTDNLGLSSNLISQPWRFYELVTYGFLHDPNDIRHILFNMFGLWIFGTELEQVYGRPEFLRIYLTTIVVAGLVWVGIETASHAQSTLLGASGGVMGVTMLYVFHFPRRLLYIYGILPVPVWLLGSLYVIVDVLGVSQADNVAHAAHLAGAAFGFIYYQSGINLGRLIPSRVSTSMFRFRPKLRIHKPEDPSRNLNEQVDQILEKISREGEASLTKKERRTLEEASRRYQQRRQ